MFDFLNFRNCESIFAYSTINGFKLSEYLALSACESLQDTEDILRLLMLRGSRRRGIGNDNSKNNYYTY